MEESEQELQKSFLKLLQIEGYEYVEIDSEDDLISNFEKQLRVFNSKTIDNFDEIYNYLTSGSLESKFDKLRRPLGDIKFIDFSDFSSNIFQVAEEVKVNREYKNRYDVLILINGIPIVQIELKKSGVELKTAFNQIQRYKKQTYSDLFDFIQLFVISNKVHTRYFLNNNSLDYNLTYTWGENRDLESFTASFLKTKNLLTVISDYIFKDLISGKYRMLRPYQIEAVESVKSNIENNENGYVWMSYNTGKTLTSLRLAEILNPDYKVVYLTNSHLSQFPEKLVVKSKSKFLRKFKRKGFVISNIRSILLLKEELEKISDEKIIFIFNEYEKYNKNYNPLILKNIFKNSLFYCFTSAPIFDENLLHDETTRYIFDNKIFTYSLRDSIDERTSLGFEIEYVNDENITSEYDFSSKKRIEEISSYIVENISEKTHNFKYKSILIASTNADLITYYSYLKNSNLKIAPILRYESNDIYEDTPMGQYFEAYIDEYNANFNASVENRKVVDTSRFANQLEADIIKRFNNGEIDLLLVDESMLHSKYKLNILGNLKNPLLNTLFLDCDLKYESLFEVLAMVSEVESDDKLMGNIITFTDTRKDINDALKLFSNNHASEDYELKNYEYYLTNYENALEQIKSSDNFSTNYEELSANYYILERFEEFDFNQTQIDEFNTYKDKYDQIIFEWNSTKRPIQDFTLKSIDHYMVDLTYIDNLLEGKAEIIYETSSDLTESSREKIISENKVSQNIETQPKVEISKNEEIPQYIVEINEGDLVENLNNELSDVNFAPVKKEIHSKECPVCGSRYKENVNFCENNAGVKLIDSDNFTKACPECGMKYESGNFCIEDPGVGLEDISNFTKQCPECGKMFKENAKFCIHCPGVKLVTAKDLVKYCPDCGAKYPENYTNCIRCQSKSQLTNIEKTRVKDIEFSPNKYYNFKSHKNHITTLEEFLTVDNVNKLANFTFTQKDYDTILLNIINAHKIILNKLICDYEIDLSELENFEKVLLYTKAFVKVQYKDSGVDFGRFLFNNIYIDDRNLDVGLEITTLIHEMSHFLISEILEQIIMEVLDTYKSDVIEAFVCYVLVRNDFNELIDEFCAHSVEVKYTPKGYQDFGSFKSKLHDINQTGEYSPSDIEIGRKAGNTFAFDIKIILDSFIDNSLRKNILEEFKNSRDVKNYDGGIYESESRLSFEGFIDMVKFMLLNDLDKMTSQDMNKLHDYVVEFEKNND